MDFDAFPVQCNTLECIRVISYQLVTWWFLYSWVGFQLAASITICTVRCWMEESSIGLVCLEPCILILHPRGASLLYTEFVGNDMAPAHTTTTTTLTFGSHGVCGPRWDRKDFFFNFSRICFISIKKKVNCHTVCW